jgi:hypothetical protein
MAASPSMSFMGAIVLFPIPVFRGLDLAVVLFNDRHAIRLGEPNKKPPGTEMFDRRRPLALCRRRPVTLVQGSRDLMRLPRC